MTVEWRSKYDPAKVVRVMTRREGWVMLRIKGCVPFVMTEKEFALEYQALQPSAPAPAPQPESPWFKAHPEYCRRCSGNGTVLAGGHSQELSDAQIVTCPRCSGTGKEPAPDGTIHPHCMGTEFPKREGE